MAGDEKKNLNHQNRDLLIGIIKSFPIIYNKSRSKACLIEKEKAWKEICERFNRNVHERYHVSNDLLLFKKKNMYFSKFSLSNKRISAREINLAFIKSDFKKL